MSAVSKRRIEAAINTLGDLAAEDSPAVDGHVRDLFGRTIYVLETIAEQRP